MHSEIRVPVSALKGRGATSCTPHRFSTEQRDQVDDGWGTLQEEVGGRPSPRTQIIFEDAHTALSVNDSPDIYFDHAVNPYRGCEHGCIYCYARPTHSYLNLSPGLDFETKIIAKRNVVAALAKDLSRRTYKPSMICIGSATDCYQPIERDLKLTRGLIELLNACHHPFSLVTKSSGVERDIDIISWAAQRRMAAVYVTITSLDPSLTLKLEPRAAAPHRRLRTIKSLADAGIPVGVSLAPHIPFLTDDMEEVLERAWDAGARTAFYHVLRLPWEVSPIFREWLSVHYPDRMSRVMSRVQEMRGGKDYESSFSTRMKGQGIWADLVKQRFQRATRKIGFNNHRIELDSTKFVPPGAGPQQSLF